MKYKSKEDAQKDHIDNYRSDGISKGKGRPLASDYLRAKFVFDNVPKNSFVLDVGVNGGTISLPLMNLGCKVKGIDIVPELVELAKSRGVFAEIGEAEDLSRFKDETFDAVVCTEVLEHLYDPVPAVEEAHRVLKPGGTYLVTVPHPQSYMASDRLGDYHQQNFGIEQLDTLFHMFFERGNVHVYSIPYDPNYCRANRLDPERPQWLAISAVKESE
jgi:2-polyprenyl-3-methyl-5-hydroxy-6-metoxy-1,4-benzoquinol methylase